MHNDSCQSSQVQGPRGCSPLAMGISYRSPRLCHPVFHKHFAKGTEKQLCRLSGTTWARLPAVEAFVGGCSPGHLPLREAAAALSWTDETPGQAATQPPAPANLQHFHVQWETRQIHAPTQLCSSRIALGDEEKENPSTSRRDQHTHICRSV